MVERNEETAGDAEALLDEIMKIRSVGGRDSKSKRRRLAGAQARALKLLSDEGVSDLVYLVFLKLFDDPLSRALDPKLEYKWLSEMIEYEASKPKGKAKNAEVARDVIMPRQCGENWETGNTDFHGVFRGVEKEIRPIRKSNWYNARVAWRRREINTARQGN